jgi:2-polyprenyl-3-methyl-5-hydroxy-6-metoxy-1,4-benzoquinol methylase
LRHEVQVDQDKPVAPASARIDAYAILYGGSDPTAHFLNERLERVLDLLAGLKAARILDVGCGCGVLFTRLAGGERELFGIDHSADRIGQAQTLTAGLNVNLVVGQLERLPFPSESFDVILALGVLEYLPLIRVGLEEIARVAKPNAVILVSMLNNASLYRWWERYFFTPASAIRSRLRHRLQQSPALRLHGKRSLTRMMQACQLEPLNVVYYDLNVSLRPFDSKCPKQTSAVNRWVEVHFGGTLRWLTHTGFLVQARKMR